MNQETKNTQDGPVLNAESFQRLLAAAYVLQGENNRRPSIPPVQKRTPSVMIREPQVQAGRPDAVIFRSQTSFNKFSEQDQSTGPASPPPVEPAFAHRMNILLFWRTVEALTIATVFCMLMGMSFHRLLLLHSVPSLQSEVREPRTGYPIASPAARVLALSRQPIVTPRQSTDGNAGDVVAEDFVIRYQERAVNLPSQAKKPTVSPVQAQLLNPKNVTLKPRVRLPFGRDADMLADTVVQYGADVKMWLGNPKRTGLDRLGH